MLRPPLEVEHGRRTTAKSVQQAAHSGDDAQHEEDKPSLRLHLNPCGQWQRAWQPLSCSHRATKTPRHRMPRGTAVRQAALV